MSKLAFRAKTVDIAYLPLRQDLLAKNVLMTAQRDFRLANSLLTDNLKPTDTTSTSAKVLNF
jgi:hypothetical protein